MKTDLANREKDPGGLRRSLDSRQIQMLAVGGVIGVGLFYGASLSVQMAGPAVLVGFVLCGLIAAVVMRALGEMTVERPVSGSFRDYAESHLGRGVGFITGWMWWFFWTATVMSELAAIGKLLQYWFPHFPAWIPGLAALVLFTGSNLLAVRVFGELEYWFAILKVLAVALFMAFGLLMMFTGAFNGGTPVGVANLWSHGGFLPNGWVGVFASLSLVVQAYSGIETLAVEAGETKNPVRNMRRAFRAVTWRILVLYIGSVLVMLCAFPWNDLIHHTGSPYVLLFAKAGIPLAATVVNLLIILSGLSSCNTGLYGGSRMLYSMAEASVRDGRFSRLNRNRVPHGAVWLTAAMISIGTLLTYLAPNSVYVWITSASAFASLWTWGVILVTELVFRRRWERTMGVRPRMAMPLWPWLPGLGLLLLVVAFIAILTSPDTRISVWSGLIWLGMLAAYYAVRGRHTYHRKAAEPPNDATS
ncbi:MAG: amino acid permease [Alicyclobacillus sp.]|nr:amino acid permease [Alicyclobacillus sp.]